MFYNLVTLKYIIDMNIILEKPNFSSTIYNIHIYFSNYKPSIFNSKRFTANMKTLNTTQTTHMKHSKNYIKMRINGEIFQLA